MPEGSEGPVVEEGQHAQEAWSPRHTEGRGDGLGGGHAWSSKKEPQLGQEGTVLHFGEKPPEAVRKGVTWSHQRFKDDSGCSEENSLEQRPEKTKQKRTMGSEIGVLESSVCCV